jgi:hypothetical protein
VLALLLYQVCKLDWFLEEDLITFEAADIVLAGDLIIVPEAAYALPDVIKRVTKPTFGICYCILPSAEKRTGIPIFEQKMQAIGAVQSISRIMHDSEYVTLYVFCFHNK